MACGEYGPGRLPGARGDHSPRSRADALSRAPGPLHQLGWSPSPSRGGSGWPAHVIVTAGPTHEPIDPVRVIANRSSGKQGFAIADGAGGARRAT